MSWTTVPLGEVLAPIQTWNPRRAPGSDTFDYIDLSSVDRDEKVIIAPTPTIPSEAPSRARQVVNSGDILVSTVRPNLNAVAVVDDELEGATASTGFSVLRPVADKVASRYIYHWVRTPSFVADMVRKATGASYPAVSDKIVAESFIPLPPLDEQRRIAGILDAADALRRRRREALALLDTLPGAIFAEMFGGLRGVAGENNIRIVELASVAEINPRMPRGLPNDMEVAFLPMAAVSVDGLIYYQEHRTVSQVRKGYTYFQRGDLLLAKITPCFENGKAAKTDDLETEHGFGTTEFHVVRTNPGELLPDYAFHLIWNPTFRKDGASNMTGSAGQKRLPVDYLKRMRIPLPSLGDQQSFVDRVRKLKNQRDDYSRQLAELDTLFASLQSRAFAGEL